MQAALIPLVRCLAILLMSMSTLAFASAQSTPKAATLFQQLQVDRTSKEAEQQLLNLAKSDRTVRTYLVAHLPPLIEMGPYPPGSNSPSPAPTWRNAATLAGELKIVEAVPALAKFIAERSSGPTETLSQESNLTAYPAGLALVKIGDPAVPAIGEVLERGNLFERVRAIYALNLIGSSKAKAVLSQHAPHEPDEGLRDFIGRATAR